jgi:hypothetical protein
MASNQGESACYLDGFATVRLFQGGRRLKLKIGTTSSAQPGMEGHATRVGIAPGHAARLSLTWRGYGVTADTTRPQALDVTLRPGAAAVRVNVPPPLFDLMDGGELLVGNWLLAA